MNIKNINVGDHIETPRFGKVKIEEVFSSGAKARTAGYTEFSRYCGTENYDWDILGKLVGVDQYVFAAVRLEAEEMPIGAFGVVSRELAITDPNLAAEEYETMEHVENVRNGRWNAKIVCTCGRAFKLAAWHSDFDADEGEGLANGTLLGITSDTGIAGIFDSAHYQDDSVVPSEFEEDAYSPVIRFDADELLLADEGRWFQYCASQTRNDSRSGVVPYGAVARAYLGSGFYYGCTRIAENGEVAYVELVFTKESPYEYADFCH